MFRARRFTVALALFAPIALHAQTRPATAPAAPISPEVYRRLPWRTIGPEGNRFSAAVGVPGRSPHLLRRIRVRRYLENHRRRHELDIALR
jgi:hypothetical protein